MKYTFRNITVALLAVCFISAGLGCSRSGQKTSQSLPDNKALRPVKKAVEQAEDELERRQEAREAEQQLELERLSKAAQELQDEMSRLRGLNDWSELDKIAERLIAVREETLEYVLSEGLKKERARALHQLGVALERKGDSVQAESRYLEALKHAQSDHQKLYLYGDLFQLYLGLKEVKKALDTAERASLLASEAEDRWRWRLAIIRVELKIEENKSRYSEAGNKLRAFLKELERDETLEAYDARLDCYELLGDIAWELNRREEAAELGVERAECSLARAKLRLAEVKNSGKR